LKELPSDLISERAILGAILIDAESVSPVLHELRLEHFSDKANQLIFRAAKALFEHSKPVDLTTLSSLLSKHDKLKAAGGREYLMKLVDETVTSASADYHAGILRERLLQRSLIETGSRISELGHSKDKGSDELLSEAVDIISNLSLENHTEEAEQIDVLGAEYLEQLEGLIRGKIVGMSSGYKVLDEFLYDVRGKLIIIAAAPSMGKTCFMLNMAYRQACQGIPVGLITLEMGREEVIGRLVQIAGHVSQKELRYGGIEQARNKVKQILTKPFYIGSPFPATTATILQKMHLWVLQYHVEAIYVDYIQLMDDAADTRSRELDKITKQLLRFAKRYKVEVVAGSQLNRELFASGNKIPKLWHIRESGGIEQGTDIVLALHRDYYFDKESENNELLLLNLKNRSGGLFTSDVRFQYFPEQHRVEERASIMA